MKKLIFLSLLAIGMTGCSVETMDSTENLLTADAKYKIQQVEKSMNLKAVEICEGEAPVFVFNFPQDVLGNGNPKSTDVHIQLYNTNTSEWESFKKLSYAGAGPEEYTYEDEVLGLGTYNFRASIGSGGFEYTATLDVVECSDCEESFSYTANADGSYTFTYVPEEDMQDEEVVFTFAQSVVASGYNWPSWNGNSSSRSETMDLNACNVYTWTVFLTGDCSGNSGKSNLWTDFKVNDVSKKNAATPNIEQSCS